MRVLVTGGAGYLGAVLVDELVNAGHAVRVFDRFCFGEDALDAWRKNDAVETVHGDIRRLQEHPGLLDGIDAVVHLASISNDISCDLNIDMAFDVNVESTRELANHCIEAGVRRFVLGSTCNVYGKGVFEYLDEQSPVNPVSSFGRTKAQAEAELLGLNGGHFEPVVARVATMFGWSSRMRFDLALNQMVATALLQKRISVMGGGKQWRPFLHVRDVARALFQLVEAEAGAVSGEIFNVGDDEKNFRIADLAAYVAEKFEDVTVDYPKADEDIRSYHVRFEKIAKTLGFSPSISVDDGITEMRAELEQRAIEPFAEPYINVSRMRALLNTPVDQGGEPIAPRFITLAKPNVGPEEERAVVETLRSGWFTTGAKVQTFEKTFSEVVNAPYTVAVTSCTAALHLSLAYLGVGAGDEVITSPITWASTGNTILHLGANVVFVDVDPETLNMDPAALEAAITPRTKAIMPVHLGGQPCDLDPIYAVANKHGISVVEDAAHALGARYHGKPIGSVGDVACFSFYAIKNITTIEGGTIALKDKETADRIRLLASNGMSAIAWQRYGRSAVAHPPEVIVPGYKYRMGDISAAMGLVQLKRFPDFKAARQRLVRQYDSVLGEVDEIARPKVIDDVEHAWHLYMIRFKLDMLNKSRDELAHALRRENVATGIHFLGLHLHEYYRETLGMKAEDYPHATKASQEILSLPLHPGMSDTDVHNVVAALKKVLLHARKS